MKIITVEEHFESAKVTAGINKATGKSAVPQLSAEMTNYMQTKLPSPEIMQDYTKDRIAFMDKYDIDMQIMSYGNSQAQNLDPKDAIPLSRLANDELAKAVASNPTRFAAMATIPVGDPEAAAAELKRAVTELGFKGLMLKGNYQGKFFDDPYFFPIFQMASDLDVPVYFHPSFVPPVITDHYYASDNWSDLVTGILGTAGFGWHLDVGVQVMRMIISGIFDKLPNLKIVSGHWGELIPMFLERLDQELIPYTDLKRSFSDYYRSNVYVTPSGILTEPQLKFLLDEVGEEHLIYSIDYPYETPETSRNFLDTSALTQAQRELFAHGNAERIYKV